MADEVVLPDLFWAALPDEETCPLCVVLDGRRAGDGWKLDGVPGDGGPPPRHPNCRCVVVDGEGRLVERFVLTAAESFARDVLGGDAVRRGIEDG
jgi:hypothetical protein